MVCTYACTNSKYPLAPVLQPAVIATSRLVGKEHQWEDTVKTRCPVTWMSSTLMTVMTFMMSSERIKDVDLVTVPDVVVPCATSKKFNAFAAMASMMPKKGAFSGSLSFVLRTALTPIHAVPLFVCHHGVLLLCPDIFNSSIWRTATPASSVSSFVCDVLHKLAKWAQSRIRRTCAPAFNSLIWRTATPASSVYLSSVTYYVQAGKVGSIPNSPNLCTSLILRKVFVALSLWHAVKPRRGPTASGSSSRVFIAQ
ncbi:hypothetical protein MTO96_016711 [Rhipicephalus appendiculatus]